MRLYLGRPRGCELKPEQSLAPVAAYLSTVIGSGMDNGRNGMEWIWNGSDLKIVPCSIMAEKKIKKSLHRTMRICDVSAGSKVSTTNLMY